MPGSEEKLRSVGRRRRLSGVVSLFLLIPLAGGMTGCGEGDLFLPELSADVEEFVSLMNDHRVSVGCEPLDWHGEVADVAQAHSDDMVARGFTAHTNPDGYSPFDRLSAAGVEYSRAAENIAWGYSSAASVLDGWLNSPGHRANLENCSLTHHGVGLNSWHWTHVFVTPR